MENNTEICALINRKWQVIQQCDIKKRTRKIFVIPKESVANEKEFKDRYKKQYGIDDFLNTKLGVPFK